MLTRSSRCDIPDHQHRARVYREQFRLRKGTDCLSMGGHRFRCIVLAVKQASPTMSISVRTISLRTNIGRLSADAGYARQHMDNI